MKRLVLGIIGSLAPIPALSQTAATPGLEQDARIPGSWTEIEAGYAPENLDNGQPDWSEVFAGVTHRDSQGRTWLGRAAHVRRFDQDDTALLAGAYLPLAEKTVLFAEGFASPTHNVLAKWSAMLQLQQGLPEGFGVLAGARTTRYNSSHLDALYLGLEKYFGDFRLAYTWSPTRSNVAPDGYSHLAQLSWYYSELSRVTLAYSSAKETDRPDLGITTTSYAEGWALYGRHMFSPRIGVGYALNHIRQGSSYDRDGVALSVIYRF
ncbi:MAG TPA: YaiO family outer membrane beta-barrel protein [Burkholderiales bacterium]|nr:YaiO family outer membrane beta-barrel protein [Burkholderiales bacterium]